MMKEYLDQLPVRGRQIWQKYVAPELRIRPDMSDVEIRTVAQVAASMVEASEQSPEDYHAVVAYLTEAREAARNMEAR